MKRSTLLFFCLGLFAGRTAMAQTICAGAAGSSTACTTACTANPPIINDEVVSGSNNGKFNVGNGNQGDGNDGFNNVGNFNIGNGNTGNCNLNSGGTGGSCDVGNDNGGIVQRFCNVYPQDGKCQPGGYLPEFTPALQTAIANIVASCQGSITAQGATPQPPPTPAAGVPPTAAANAAQPTTPATAGTAAALAPGSSRKSIPVSDSKASFNTLLSLLAEHIKQEKAAGRKMML